MTEAKDRLPPPDEVNDVTNGEMLREVLFFAAIIGLIAGGGYGLFAGYSEWHQASTTAAKKSASIIPLWGLLWAVGGAAVTAVFCGVLASIFLGAARLVRQLVRK